ncbi:MAG: glycosyltransferase [Thermoplasmata archaeon]
MRIGLFTDTYLPAVDGVVNSLLTTRKALEEMGHEVVVCAPEDRRNCSPSDVKAIYCKAREFKKYPGYRMARLFSDRLTLAMRKYNPDLMHSHGIAVVGMKSMWASRELKVPYVLTFHTMVLDALNYYSPVKLNLSFMTWIIRRYLRFFLHRCKGVVVPTSAIAREVRAIAPRVKMMEVIPTGIDTERFNTNVSGRKVREQWNLDGNELILHVGRISPEKNVNLLLSAFSLVKKEKPNAKLMFVGSGPALKDCKKRVERMGLGDDIIFTGFIDDQLLPNYYAACDAFAITSKFETQGLVVLESMASGKCVAGVNFRAIPEFVKEGETGFLFEPDNPFDCSRAIIRALECESSLRKHTRRMAERYSIRRCTERLVSFYETLVESSK